MTLPDYREDIYLIYKSVEDPEERLIFATIMSMVLASFGQNVFKKDGNLVRGALKKLENDITNTLANAGRQGELIPESIYSTLSQNLGRDRNSIPKSLPRLMLPIYISYINLKNGSEIIESKKSLREWAFDKLAKQELTTKEASHEAGKNVSTSLNPQNELIVDQNESPYNAGVSKEVHPPSHKGKLGFKVLVATSIILILVACIIIFLNFGRQERIVDSNHPNFNHTLEWANGSDTSQTAMGSDPKRQCSMVTVGNVDTDEGINAWPHGETCWSTSISPVNPPEIVNILVKVKLLGHATESATNISVRLLNVIPRDKGSSQKFIFLLSGEGKESHTFFTAVDSVTVDFTKPVIPRIEELYRYPDARYLDSSVIVESPILYTSGVKIPDIHPNRTSYLSYAVYIADDSLLSINAQKNKNVTWADGSLGTGQVDPTNSECECSILAVGNLTTGEGIYSDLNGETCCAIYIPPVSSGDRIRIFLKYKNIGSEPAINSRLRILPFPKAVDSSLLVIAEILATGKYSEKIFVQYDTLEVKLKESFWESFNNLQIEYTIFNHFPPSFFNDDTYYEFEFQELYTSGIALADIDPFDFGYADFDLTLTGNSTKNLVQNSSAQIVNVGLIGRTSKKAFTE